MQFYCHNHNKKIILICFCQFDCWTNYSKKVKAHVIIHITLRRLSHYVHMLVGHLIIFTSVFPVIIFGCYVLMAKKYKTDNCIL